MGVNTTIEEDFALDPAKVEAAITPRTKAMLLNYPCNPTGAVLPHDVQDELARIAVRHDLLVYSDEIYDRLVYGGYEMRTMSSLPGMRRRTVLMGGFSKAYAMTGWRIGYICAPSEILEGILKVHQYVIMSAPTVAQDAALEALKSGESDVRWMLSHYDRRRQLLVEGFNKIGLRTFEPKGAFYVFPQITSTGLDQRRVRRAAAAQGIGRGRSGLRLRRGRRRPRPLLLRHLGGGAQGGPRPDRAVRRQIGERLVTATGSVATRYEAVIGIEIHCQLKTASKMFCGCSTEIDGAAPNSHCCPVCLGLPGVLPTINKAAVEWVIATGFAIDAAIATTTRWDRKNYFYPDLPKGYQISQYQLPLAANGRLTFDTSDGPFSGPSPAGPPRGGHRPPHPFAELGRPAGQPDRLQPLGHAAHGDRDRAGHQDRRAGPPVRRRASIADEDDRRLGRGDGERPDAGRGQRLDPAASGRRRSGPGSRSRT